MPWRYWVVLLGVLFTVHASAAGLDRYNGRYACRQNFPDGQSLVDTVQIGFQGDTLQSLAWESVIVLNNLAGRGQTGGTCSIDQIRLGAMQPEGKGWRVEINDSATDAKCTVLLTPQAGNLRIEAAADCREQFCGARGDFAPLLLQTHSGRCKYLPGKKP